jgi:exonuclease SbcC
MGEKPAITADLHLTAANYEQRLAALKRAAELAADRGVIEFFIAGDIFDRFNVAGREASLGTMLKATRGVLECAGEDCGIEWHLIPGNHDAAPRGQLDGLYALETARFLTIHHRFQTYICAGGTICLLPWVSLPLSGPRLARFQEGLSVLIRGDFAKHGGPGVIIGHCDVEGAETASGYVSIGGSFLLDRAFFKGLGAHLVVLGHWHKRQDLGLSWNGWGGYVGSLVETNFGEGSSTVPGQERQGNPAGFLIVELDRLRDEHEKALDWVTLDDQDAGYATCAADDPRLPEHKAAGRRIRIISEHAPAQGEGEGVEWLTVPPQAPIRVRVEDVRLDDAPAELLGRWLEHMAQGGIALRGHDDPLLLNTLADLEKATATVATAHGSLARIDSIRLTNIGCHGDTLLDLNGLRGLIGIAGANGAGKTFLLEAPFAALFGEFPSRPGGLEGAVARDLYGDALIEVAFRAIPPGCQMVSSFRVTRSLHRTPRTFGHEACVYCTENAVASLLAGPKVGDVGLYTGRLVGDPSLVLSSVFSAQGQIKNFIDATPADRKDTFARLLGSDRLLLIGDEARKRRLEVDKRLQEVLTRRAILQQEVQKLPSIEEILTRAQANLAAAQEATARADEVATKAKSAALIGREDVTKREALLQALDEGRRRLAGLRRVLETRMGRLSALQSRVANLPGGQLTSDARAQLYQQVEAADGALSAARASFEGLRDASRAADKALSAAASDHRAADHDLLSAIDLENQRRTAAIARCENDVRHAETALESWGTQAVNAQKEAQQLDAAAEKATCRAESTMNPSAVLYERCPLYQLAHERAASARLMADQLTSRKEGAQREAQVAHRALHEAQEALQANPAPAGLLDALAAKKTALVIRQQAAEAALQVTEKAQQITEQAELASASLHQQLKTALAAEEERYSILKEAAELKAQTGADLQVIAEVQAAVTAREAEEKQVSARLANQPAAERALKEALTTLSGCHQVEVDAGRALGHAQQTHAAAKEAQEQCAALDRQTGQDYTLLDRVDVLEKAFGRDGIPQLLADSALPRLRSLLAELLTGWDGRWSIDLRTQGETKAGQLRERLDVVVADAYTGLEADIADYSGGEKHLIRTLMRVALGLLQAERVGHGYHVFFADEAFDALDSDNALRLVGAFQRLLGHFEQVFIVSHDDTFLGLLPTTIHLSRPAGGRTKVVVVTEETPQIEEGSPA